MSSEPIGKQGYPQVDCDCAYCLWLKEQPETFPEEGKMDCGDSNCSECHPLEDIDGVYQPKCPCGSFCWRCHPEPSSITNEDVIWRDEHQWDTAEVIEDIQDAVSEHGYVKISRILEETTAGAFLEYLGTDAQRWASEYCGIHGGDESQMIGWFANAIEAGKAARNDG